MLDLSVYKPPEEYKLNHDAGIVNASKWSVSCGPTAAGSQSLQRIALRPVVQRRWPGGPSANGH
jgi:hypothetical protein